MQDMYGWQLLSRWRVGAVAMQLWKLLEWHQSHGGIGVHSVPCWLLLPHWLHCSCELLPGLV